MCEELEFKIVRAVKHAAQLVKEEFADLNVNERALTHRLAVRLERDLLFASYHVDCEYNRDGQDPKG